MEILDIVMKLIGEVEPLGCSRRDSIRLTNTESLGDLTVELIKLLQDLSFKQISHEHSVAVIGKKAQSYLNEIKEWV